MNWADLFERADADGTDVETIREALAARRDRRARPADEDGEAERDG